MELELILQIIVAFLISITTFFTGFGLGTVMLPLMLLSYDIVTAVLATSIIHLINNVTKIGFLYKSVDSKVLLRFGIPSILFSFIGAQIITEVADINQIAEVVIGASIIVFALYDILFKSKAIHITKNQQVVGGMLSGLFGGISGHQGAIRSAFLINAGLSKTAFIATGTALSLFIDLTRIPVYLESKDLSSLDPSILLIILSAILGVLLGKRFLNKTTIKIVRYIVAVGLILFGTYMIMK